MNYKTLNTLFIIKPILNKYEHDMCETTQCVNVKPKYRGKQKIRNVKQEQISPKFSTKLRFSQKYLQTKLNKPNNTFY